MMVCSNAHTAATRAADPFKRHYCIIAKSTTEICNHEIKRLVQIDQNDCRLTVPRVETEHFNNAAVAPSIGYNRSDAALPDRLTRKHNITALISPQRQKICITGNLTNIVAQIIQRKKAQKCSKELLISHISRIYSATITMKVIPGCGKLISGFVHGL